MFRGFVSVMPVNVVLCGYENRGRDVGERECAAKGTDHREQQQYLLHIVPATSPWKNLFYWSFDKNKVVLRGGSDQ
jgi:hypothetical protein